MSLVAEADVRISPAGACGLLLDVGSEEFDLAKQQRLWALAARLTSQPPAGVREPVLGVNNLLVVLDPLELHPAEAAEALLRLWQQSEPLALAGRDIEVETSYDGEDLAEVAAAVGLRVDEVAKVHSEAEYTVACLGAMPGLAYMVGLPERLTLPRRAVPRGNVRAGAVIVAGVQASVLPSAGPCGWHVLGSTGMRLFDPHQSPPCLFAAGDRVRFVAKAVRA